MLSAILYFIAGFLLGHLIPRVPFMVLSRTSGFNKRFPPHPEPIPLSPRLTQRVLHMQFFHKLGTWTTLLPIIFGYASILGGLSTFGYGLFSRVVGRCSLALKCFLADLNSLHPRDGSAFADGHEHCRFRRCLLSSSTT